MEDRKRNPRQRTYKGGRINFERGAGIDCLIRNLSDTGACLEVESAVVGYERFALVIKPEYLTRICQITWRKPHKIGVRFV